MDESEYHVYFVQFPGDIEGATRVDCDGFASIYINASLAPKAARETFDHEVRHLKNDDFYNYTDLEEAERRAG